MSRAAFLRGLSGPQLPTSALQAVEAFDQKLDAISRERFQPAREAELRAAALDELQRTLRTERDRALSALEAADEKAEAQALAAARDRLPTSPDDSQNFTMRQVASLTHTLRKSVDTQLDVASRERHARLFQIADLRYAVVNVTVNRFVGLFCHVSRSLLMATHTSSYANRKP